MIVITDPTDLRVQEFLTLRNKCTGESILCDSEKVVAKLFETSLLIEKVFVTTDYFATHRELLQNRVDPQGLFVAEREVIEQVLGYKLHHGVMAKAKAPLQSDLKDLGERILILNGVTSPENVGAIVRSAAAFGVTSIISDQKSASPLLRRAIRVSMGNVFFMQHHSSSKLLDTLRKLSELGYSILGTANEENSVTINQFEFPKKLALIIGSEGWGMDAEIRCCCDKTLKIPVDNKVAHLNAAIAASIFLYQLAQ